MNLLKIIIIVKAIVPTPASREAAVLGLFLLLIVPRKISVRNCKASNMKCLETFLPEYQLPKRLKILGKLHTLQWVFCGEEALLE